METNNDISTRLTNGAILIISTVLKHVMSSAAEAEIGALLLNSKETTVICKTLEELGHLRPPQHPYKLTIPQPQDTAIGKWNKNAHDPWICAFIG
jgi:hypothetical protein